MTKAEGKIWNLALRKDRTGYRFLRQKLIGNYILDFYCDRLKLGIELDDNSHDWKGEYDKERTRYLNKIGIEIIRYTNKNIYYQLDSVIIDLERRIKNRSIEIKKSSTLKGTPSGNPFPKGTPPFKKGRQGGQNKKTNTWTRTTMSLWVVDYQYHSPSGIFA